MSTNFRGCKIALKNLKIKAWVKLSYLMVLSQWKLQILSRQIYLKCANIACFQNLTKADLRILSKRVFTPLTTLPKELRKIKMVWYLQFTCRRGLLIYQSFFEIGKKQLAWRAIVRIFSCENDWHSELLDIVFCLLWLIVSRIVHQYYGGLSPIRPI